MYLFMAGVGVFGIEERRIAGSRIAEVSPAAQHYFELGGRGIDDSFDGRLRRKRPGERLAADRALPGAQ
jgi:hypothetical protein